MRTLSYSQWDVFQNCERRWYYERIARLPLPPAPQLEVGSLYHAVIEHVVRTYTAAHPPADRLSVDWTELGLLRVAQLAGEEPAALQEEILRNVQRLNDQLLAKLKVRGVELRFKRMGEAGRIDCVADNAPITDSRGNIIGMEDRPCVLDWKVKFTNRNRRTQQAADDSDQLGLYACEADVDLAGFVEIPRDVTLPLRTFVTEFSKEDRQRIRRYFTEQFQAMRSRGQNESAYRLSARNNALCSARWCPFHRHCPGGQGEKRGPA